MSEEYLHPDDSINEEEHHDEQSHMGERLKTKQTVSSSEGCRADSSRVRADGSIIDLEGLNEGPQQVPDALRTVQQLHQTHDTEESEERDGN